MPRKNKPVKRPRPVVLVVLDGWGIYEAYEGNAIARANTPAIDDLIVRYPATTLRPGFEPGDSDKEYRGSCIIGHQVIGTGNNYKTSYTRINESITDRTFYKNEVLLKTIDHAAKYNSNLHLLCLLDDSGQDGSIKHLLATLRLVKGTLASKVYLHVFLDGKNSPNKSGIRHIKRIERVLSKEGIGRIATITGSLFALNRNKNWERTEKAYLALTEGRGNIANDPVSAIEESYKNKIFDEEFSPTVIYKHNEQVGKIKHNDAIIFLNLDPDSSRQLAKAFTQKQFNKFKRPKKYKNIFFTTLIECEKNLSVNTAFPPEKETSSLSEAISESGYKQLKICEISRLGQLTYFFNGLKEEKFNNEDIIIIPEAGKENYKYSPELNIKAITNNTLKAIARDYYDFIALNFPDVDIAAHSGDISAAIKTIETIDSNIKILVKSVLDSRGVVIITSDHGNAEAMLNLKTEETTINHTSHPLPLIIAGKDYEGRSLGLGDTAGSDLNLGSPRGGLADIAPMILKIMNIDTPEEMTGKNLITI